MTNEQNPPSVSSLAQSLTAGCLGFGVILVVFIAGKTTSGAFQFHAFIIMAAFLAGIIAIFNLGGRINDEKHTPSPSGVYYNNTIIKYGVIASAFWGIAGFLVGDVLAWQLAFPALNFDMPWTNFGRLRPLHTSAVIFAFGGNVLLATSFYVVQRTSCTSSGKVGFLSLYNKRVFCSIC